MAASSRRAERQRRGAEEWEGRGESPLCSYMNGRSLRIVSAARDPTVPKHSFSDKLLRPLGQHLDIEHGQVSFGANSDHGIQMWGADIVLYCYKPKKYTCRFILFLIQPKKNTKKTQTFGCQASVGVQIQKSTVGETLFYKKFPPHIPPTRFVFKGLK